MSVDAVLNGVCHSFYYFCADSLVGENFQQHCVIDAAVNKRHFVHTRVIAAVPSTFGTMPLAMMPDCFSSSTSAIEVGITDSHRRDAARHVAHEH